MVLHETYLVSFQFHVCYYVRVCEYKCTSVCVCVCVCGFVCVKVCFYVLVSVCICVCTLNATNENLRKIERIGQNLKSTYSKGNCLRLLESVSV